YPRSLSSEAYFSLSLMFCTEQNDVDLMVRLWCFFGMDQISPYISTNHIPLQYQSNSVSRVFVKQKIQQKAAKNTADVSAA
ncbi:MAG: hypothetical protein IIY45_02845, partial [Firmicutes bacterium]|nr:hypothetical protein [Bacillota bacterium]